MIKVCTQAGLSSSEKRLFSPASAVVALVRDEEGEPDRERDDDGLRGGEGRRELDRDFRDEPRPASSA